jgi:2-hydroxychromene-2-carboxylate isomerase
MQNAALATNMAKPKITLFVDIVSPFAYMGYYMLRHHPAFSPSKVNVTYIPIFLGGLMKKCENRAPIEIRNKDKWINVERLRWAKQFNIPIAPSTPPGFPVLTLHTMRAICYLNEKYSQEDVVKALDALYQSFWVEANSGVGKPDGEKGFGAILKAVLSKEVHEDVMANAASKSAKDALMANTDWAFDDGAFGLPWFQCENAEGQKESFWGFDHLGQVLKHLGLEKEGELKSLL